MRSPKLTLPLLVLLLAFVAVGYNYLSDRAAGREASSSLCLAAFFGIVALSLLWNSSGASKQRRLRRLAKRAQARGRPMEKPWLARPEWRSGEITLDTYDNLNRFGIALVSVVWLLVGLFPSYDLLKNDPFDWFSWGVALVMVGIPIAILARTPAKLRQMEKTCDATLVLGQPAGPMHERFLATVSIADMTIRAPVHTSLVCVERTFHLSSGGSSHAGKGDAFRGGTGGGFGGTHRSDEELWRHDIELDEPRIIRAGGVVTVPCEFGLPRGVAETTALLPGADGVVWRVEVLAPTSEGDFHGLFEVPVFFEEGGPT